MSEIWNLWNLKPPPVCTVKTKLHFKEIQCLKDGTFNAVKTMKYLNFLDREAAILSRFLYKHKRTFRHDKGLQNLVKVNQCLKRYLKLDMPEVLLTFKNSLPHKVSPTASYVYLPTKQMLKWVLLRLQAFSQIFLRVLHLTKESGMYFYQKICLGWSLNLSLLVFSITGRILCCSKYLVLKSIEWYSLYYKYLSVLKESAQFLPEYTFPADLKQWLGPVDVTPLKKKILIDNIFEFIDLTNDDEDNDDDNDDDEVKLMKEKYVQTFFKMDAVDAEEICMTEIEQKEKGIKRPLRSFLNEDVGVPIKDEEIFKRPRKNKRSVRKSYVVKKISKT